MMQRAARITTVTKPTWAPITPMPPENVAGGGRDRRFLLPQYFTELLGCRTAFCDSREGDRAVLFIHGLAGNITHWVNVASHFTSHCRVLGVDLPGHGETDKPPGPYSVEQYVDHVVALLDRVGIERVTIVGHSMGGMVSTAFALRHPDRTEAAVLVNPAGMQPVPKPFRIAGHALLRKRILNPILPRVWQHGILGNVFYQKNTFTEAFIRTANESYELEDVYEISMVMEALKHDLLDRNYSDMLKKLKTPVWLIWGDKDRLVPARFLRKAARVLPNVRIEEIADCGHMPIIERPQRVIRFLERALDATS